MGANKGLFSSMVALKKPKVSAQERAQTRTLYKRGAANLALEGMELSLAEHKIAMRYFKGEISRAEFVAMVLAHVRSN